MAGFERIYQSQNFLEFDFVVDALDEAGIEYFTQEMGDIFSAGVTQQLLVRDDRVPEATRQIARAVLARERPDERFDFDQDLARGLRELREQNRTEVAELLEANQAASAALLEHMLERVKRLLK